MYKELIKKYAKSLTPDQVKEYALKEGVEVSNEEASLFVNVVQTRLDEMLEGNALEVLNEYKSELSTSSYNKLLELYDKYKKFLN